MALILRPDVAGEQPAGEDAGRPAYAANSRRSTPTVASAATTAVGTGRADLPGRGDRGVAGKLRPTPKRPSSGRISANP